MTKVTLKSNRSALRRVNLTRYVSFIAKYNYTDKFVTTPVSLPSEAYLNTDGTLSVSSRQTETGFSRLNMNHKVFYGVRADMTVEEITFS